MSLARIPARLSPTAPKGSPAVLASPARAAAPAAAAWCLLHG